MGWFRKKDRVIDLTEYYNRRQQETSQTDDVVDLSSNASSATKTESDSGSFFGGIFGDANNSSPTPPSIDAPPSEIIERRQKLAKRLKDMTDKMEEVSNQIYHLQQRVELLERKMDVNRF